MQAWVYIWILYCNEQQLLRFRDVSIEEFLSLSTNKKKKKKKKKKVPKKFFGGVKK